MELNEIVREARDNVIHSAADCDLTVRNFNVIAKHTDRLAKVCWAEARIDALSELLRYCVRVGTAELIDARQVELLMSLDVLNKTLNYGQTKAIPSIKLPGQSNPID